MTSKNALRREARAKRARLAADLPDFAEAIAAFASSLELQPGILVAFYWPLRDEADPRGLAAALAAQGHRLLLPCIAGPTSPLDFRPWRQGDRLTANLHGIGEPSAEADSLVPGAVLVPLLAFDGKGSRLGYGGGYYDRTLAALRAQAPVRAIGIAFSGQEVAVLPCEGHDERLDMVVTEKGVRDFAA